MVLLNKPASKCQVTTVCLLLFKLVFFWVDLNIIDCLREFTFCLSALHFVKRILFRGLKIVYYCFSNQLISNKRFFVAFDTLHLFVGRRKSLWNFRGKICNVLIMLSCQNNEEPYSADKKQELVISSCPWKDCAPISSFMWVGLWF